MKSIVHPIFTLSLFLAAIVAAETAAAQQWETIVDQLTDETLAVARLQNDEATRRWLRLLDLPLDLDASQLGDGPITVVVSAKEIRLMLDDPAGSREKLFKRTHAGLESWEIARVGDQTILSTDLWPGSETAKPLNAKGEQAWQEALAQRGEHTMFIAISPSDQTRRVISELSLGMPVSSGLSEVPNVIRQFDWFTLNFDVERDQPMKLTVQAARDIDAAELARGFGSLAAAIGPAMQDHEMILDLTLILATTSPVIEGSRITFSVIGSEGPSMKQHLEKLLGQQESVNASKLVRRLVLAMLNYESGYSKYPGPAVGKGESKGLSWRVAILPYIEQQNLHQQFHLDEPWDSEHNKKLIPKMPRAFLHGSSRLVPTDGRSSFIVPTGPGLMFEPGVARLFKDLKDGTSNTVHILAVDDEHAEVWTKPVENNFDPQNPRNGLLLSPRDEYLFGRADGWVQLLKNTVSDDTLRALMTIAGGEVIPSEK